MQHVGLVISSWPFFCTQAFGMPNPRHASQLVKLIASVIEADRLNGGYNVSELELLRLERMMVPPGLRKLLKIVSIRDADQSAFREYGNVGIGFSFHGGGGVAVKSGGVIV